MSYTLTIRDAESYRQRLERFLSDKCLLFNPYTVSDARLWAGLLKMKWRGPYSLTQMVVLHFTGISTDREGLDVREYVTYSIGDSTEEITRNMRDFTFKRTAADSLCPVRSLINSHPITQARQIHSLIGKSVFVSRYITTVKSGYGYGVAMAMHRLTNNLSVDAAAIRTAIINSKLEMLDRLLTYPHAHIYLDGEPSPFVDIATPIGKTKALISTYSTVIPPVD